MNNLFRLKIMVLGGRTNAFVAIEIKNLQWLELMISYCSDINKYIYICVYKYMHMYTCVYIYPLFPLLRILISMWWPDYLAYHNKTKPLCMNIIPTF